MSDRVADWLLHIAIAGAAMGLAFVILMMVARGLR